MERYVFAIKNIFLKLKRLCFRICSNLYFFKTKYKTHMNIIDGINITEGTMKGPVLMSQELLELGVLLSHN